MLGAAAGMGREDDAAVVKIYEKLAGMTSLLFCLTADVHNSIDRTLDGTPLLPNSVFRTFVANVSIVDNYINYNLRGEDPREAGWYHTLLYNCMSIIKYCQYQVL